MQEIIISVKTSNNRTFLVNVGTGLLAKNIQWSEEINMVYSPREKAVIIQVHFPQFTFGHSTHFFSQETENKGL